jgi:hypothetical protein
MRGTPYPQPLIFDAMSERRLALRVALRAPARVFVGLVPISATLLDLSLTGCRFLSPRPVLATGHAWLWLPAGLGGALPRPLRGEVSWAESVSGQPTGVCEVGMRFDRFLPGQTQRLLRALSQLLAGPREPTRRREPRVPFGRRVIARGAERPRILVGQDLSFSGIRVQGGADLEIGAELQLAIHGGGPRPPLVVSARVLRHDAHEGTALRFEGLGEPERRYLGEILEQRPPLVTPTGAPAVVTELLRNSGV